MIETIHKISSIGNGGTSTFADFADPQKSFRAHFLLFLLRMRENFLLLRMRRNVKLKPPLRMSSAHVFLRMS